MAHAPFPQQLAPIDVCCDFVLEMRHWPRSVGFSCCRTYLQLYLIAQTGGLLYNVGLG